jgi:hypothetical protein
MNRDPGKRIVSKNGFTRAVRQGVIELNPIGEKGQGGDRVSLAIRLDTQLGRNLLRGEDYIAVNQSPSGECPATAAENDTTRSQWGKDGPKRPSGVGGPCARYEQSHFSIWVLAARDTEWTQGSLLRRVEMTRQPLKLFFDRCNDQQCFGRSHISNTFFGYSLADQIHNGPRPLAEGLVVRMKKTLPCVEMLHHTGLKKTVQHRVQQKRRLADIQVGSQLSPFNPGLDQAGDKSV